jgi:serine protease AprX
MGKRKKPGVPPDAPQNPPGPSQPDSGTEAKQDQHTQAVVQAEVRRKETEKSRPDELRTNMMRSVVTEPLLSKVQEAEAGTKFEVIISLNEMFPGGIDEALKQVKDRAKQWGVKYTCVSNYCFACLTKEHILELAEEARALIKAHGPSGSVVYRIWQDDDISVTLTHSLTTVKADAAQRAFQARGDNIVWAILDSGIHGEHDHFKPFKNLDLRPPLDHMDFTPLNNGAKVDKFGHGTHVAGIVAGYWQSQSPDPDGEPVAGTEMRDETSNDAVPRRDKLRSISGVAPECKLVSLKVVADLDVVVEPRQKAGQGKVSWVLQAIDQIQQWNQYGKRLLIHGVNMSLGYDFDPRWFGCGQSPICVEVNRLVKSGVVVIVSAGNAGYSSFINAAGKSEARFSDLTITDPGNADLAITVGSTHRDMPHLYGVSYFSSRGPTGDGRMKPDLVAPGERIISCAAGREALKYDGKDDQGNNLPAVLYCEQTGTSMAAPHVSGAVAAFLSVRREFIGQPERVKELFVDNAIDLRREPKFQGAGLLDIMKVLQAV